MIQRIGGSGVSTQSFESPRRTKNALVKAANNMTLAASSTSSPVIEALREAPRLSPSPPPKPVVAGGAPRPPTISVVIDPGML
ncbi:MAG: hypothetical protein DMG58_14055 [Acidobacteria bacterium]|nr:MAG: hypothetical protein DMG58_14055 [Acidobacteriota bacterium]